MCRLPFKLFPVTFLAAVIIAGCACAAPAVPRPQAAEEGPSPIRVDNATHIELNIAPLAVEPDSVEVIYFHRRDQSADMAAVSDSIKYAVTTYFKDELSTGKVKLTIIVSDDPANADIVRKYNVTSFALVIRETRQGAEESYPVSDIWQMTGEENRAKLVNFIRVLLEDALAGRGP